MAFPFNQHAALASAILFATVLASVALPARALAGGGNGGTGGAFFGGDGPGGAGGADGANGQPGGNATVFTNNGGGGGGGGGSGGGAGGTGGNGGGASGGTAGNTGSSSGANFNGAGGGGGGNGGLNGASSPGPTFIVSPVTGSVGGTGGNGGNTSGVFAAGGGGGGGGAGGIGLLLTGATANTNNSTITGGIGGNGGNGGNTTGGSSGEPSNGGNGGNGGDGGAGVASTVAGTTLTNNGTIQGGNGGTGGIGGISTGGPNGGAAAPNGSNGAGGLGGTGISGAGLTIINNGTISGGFANGGTGAQGFGIAFTGGFNSLGNTGTITGISVQGGSFAPALATSAIGTPLTFNGPLTFASGTQYVVRVSPGASDNATTSGAAMLNGATVDAQVAPGSYALKQYTILTAAGGLGGTTFNGGVSSLPGFAVGLSYTPTDVLMNLTAALGGPQQVTSLNQNQQGVASAINNFFNHGGALPPNFVNLFGLTDGNLGNALSQLDGEVATGAERVGFQLTNEFLQLMLDPFVNGRAGVGHAGPAIGFAPDERANLPRDIAQAYDSILGKAPPPTLDQRWTAWSAGFGGSNTTSGNATVGSNNVTTQTLNIAAGIDYHVTPYAVLGFAVAGGGTNWGLANSLGSGKSDAFQAGAYGITWSGPAYLAGALAFTNNWFTTNREALGDDFNARFEGQSYGGRLELGYRNAVLPTLGVTPYSAVQAQYFRTPSYSESDLTGGGFGLTYAAMNATDVRTELGARFDDSTLLFDKPLILFGRVAWAHDFVSNPSLSAAFQSLPGASFVVNGAPIPLNSALASAGAQFFLTSNWSLIAKFDGEFAPGSQTYAGSATLRLSW